MITEAEWERLKEEQDKRMAPYYEWMNDPNEMEAYRKTSVKDLTVRKRIK